MRQQKITITANATTIEIAHAADERHRMICPPAALSSRASVLPLARSLPTRTAVAASRGAASGAKVTSRTVVMIGTCDSERAAAVAPGPGGKPLNVIVARGRIEYGENGLDDGDLDISGS